ncbi:MAG: MBL fold metallo-hydrolase [Ktedonobacterales bacterium]
MWPWESGTAGRREASILYDAGLGRDTVQYNMDVLGLSAGDLRAVALSHGHVDHHGGAGRDVPAHRAARYAARVAPGRLARTQDRLSHRRRDAPATPQL